jgi:hypothetical protein
MYNANNELKKSDGNGGGNHPSRGFYAAIILRFFRVTGDFDFDFAFAFHFDFFSTATSIFSFHFSLHFYSFLFFNP